MTPTQRALKVCKDQGWTAGIVEKWNPHARIRQDLFGCIDLIVADEGEGILGVQVTSGANVAARLTKAKVEPRLVKWLSSGGRFEVWGFRKLAKRKADGKKSKVKEYVLRRVELCWNVPLGGKAGLVALELPPLVATESVSAGAAEAIALDGIPTQEKSA